jgi:ribosome biogenesis GTPase
LNTDLYALGWGADFEIQLDSNDQSGGRVVGRVVEQQRDLWRVALAGGEAWCGVSGRMRHDALRAAELPAVGDWVIAEALTGGRGVIVRVLDRRSAFIRAGAQTGAPQVVAANVDTALVVSALNADHNLRRLERYVALAYQSGATPVVLLSKSDLHADPVRAAGEAEAVAPGVLVLTVSARCGDGVDALRAAVRPGRTAVLLGSSGAGKSTLVNALAGERVQVVQGVSGFKDKGRHTTTARRLIVLPHGGLIIDTPGMRELALADAESGVSLAFDDVETLARSCRFTDCQHAGEPGCAIASALADGRLDPDRLRSFRKLQREASFQARQEDAQLMRIEREKWKKRSRQAQENVQRKRLW